MLRKLSVLMLLWFLAAPVAAEPAPSITLAGLFRLADAHSPALQAAHHEVAAHSGAVRQAGLYPNPELEFELADVDPDHLAHRTDKLALSQRLIVGGRRGAAIDAARARRDAASERQRLVRRGVYQRIHTLWAGQLHARQALPAVEQLLERARATLDLAEARFEARSAPEAHVARAMLAVFELEVIRQAIQQEQAEGAVELTALVGANVTPEQIAGSLDTGLPAVETTADHHPSSLAAHHQVEAAAADLRRRRAERIPDLGLFVAYGRNRTADERFVEAGMSLPLPIFHRNQGAVAEGRALQALAQEQARATAGRLSVELVSARQRHAALSDQSRTTERRLLPVAERGLDQAQAGYRTGHLGFNELIEAQSTLSSLRLRHLELRRDLVIAAAHLMSLAGSGPYADEEMSP